MTTELTIANHWQHLGRAVVISLIEDIAQGITPVDYNMESKCKLNVILEKNRNYQEALLYATKGDCLIDKWCMLAQKDIPKLKKILLRVNADNEFKNKINLLLGKRKYRETIFFLMEEEMEEEEVNIA